YRRAQRGQETGQPELVEHRPRVAGVAKLRHRADQQPRDQQQRRHDERRAGHRVSIGVGQPARPAFGNGCKSDAVSDARPDAVVVGGGIAGLVAARDLAAAGLSVLLLEGSPDVGGKLRLGSVGGTMVDVGAESMLARRPEAVGLLAELGLDVVHPSSGSPGLWTRGALRRLPRTLLGVPLDLDAVAATCVLSPDGVGRARPEAGVPLRRDDVSVADLIGSRLGSEVVDRLADPLLGGVYAGHASLLSARAAVPQVVSLLREHGSLAAAAAAAPPPSDDPVFAGI